VSDDDLSLSFSGGSVYIPLDSAVVVSTTHDVIALVRCLPDSGFLRIGTGGAVPQGSAFVIDAASFLISYPASAPIVRIHLADPVTGLSDDQTGHPNVLTVSPNPTRDRAVVRFSSAIHTQATLDIHDAQGRRMHSWNLPAGTETVVLDMSGWPAGLYVVRVIGPSSAQSARLILE